jgi:hypothetical protein
MKRFFLIPLLALLLAAVGCTCTVSENGTTPTKAPTAKPTATATTAPTVLPTASAAPESTVAPVMPTEPAVSPSAPATAGN